MHVIDGIAYADNPTPAITIKSVRPLDSYRLWLRFSTGEEKVFDFVPLLDEPCFRPLKDEKVFREVYVDYGVPVWNDGEIDISPETLYENGVAVELSKGR